MCLGVVLADLNPKPDNPHVLLSCIILRKGCRKGFGRQGTDVSGSGMVAFASAAEVPLNLRLLNLHL